MSKIFFKKLAKKIKSYSINNKIEQPQQESFQNKHSSKNKIEKMKSPKQDAHKIDSENIKNSKEDSSNKDLQKDNSKVKEIKLNPISEGETKDKNIMNGSTIENIPLVKKKCEPKPMNSELIEKYAIVLKNMKASTINGLSFQKNIQDEDNSFICKPKEKVTTIDVRKKDTPNDFQLANILSDQKIQDQKFLEQAINKKKVEDKVKLEQENAYKDIKNKELLEKFKQLLKTSFEAECVAFDGWKVHKSTKNLSISSKLSASKTKIIKAIAIFENTDVTSVFNYVMDPYKYKNWDKDKIASHCIYKSGTNANIQYIIRAMPLSLTARDALILRFWECNEETCIIYQSSVEHKKIPQSTEYIRAQMDMSGFKIKQNNDDVVINFVMEADPKGSIPKFLQNKLTVNPCFNFFKKLLENYKDTLYCDKFINQCNLSSVDQMFKNSSELNLDDIKIYIEQYIAKNFDKQIPSSLASVRKLEKVIYATSEPRRAKTIKRVSITSQKTIF